MRRWSRAQNRDADCLSEPDCAAWGQLFRLAHIPLLRPGCWNRDTARYGLRRLVPCTACPAAPQGQVHQREVPESGARIIRRGAT